MIYLELVGIDGQDGVQVTAHCPTIAQQVYVFGLVKVALKNSAIPPVESLVMSEAQEQEFTLLDRKALETFLIKLVDQEMIFCLSTKRIELKSPINEIHQLQSTKLYFSSDFVSGRDASKAYDLKEQEKAAIRDFDNWVWRKIVPKKLKEALR